MSRIKRVWYGVADNCDLFLLGTSPSNLLEMNFSVYIEELDGVAFCYTEDDIPTYFLGPEGLTGEMV